MDNWSRGYTQVLNLEESGGRQLSAARQMTKVAMEILQVMMEMWTPYGTNLCCLMFSGEVGYEWPVPSAIDA